MKDDLLVLFSVSTLLMVCGTAHAQPVPELSRQFHEQLSRVPQAAALQPGEDEDTDDDDAVGPGWYLGASFVEISPYIGVRVPGVARVEVIAELDFIWDIDDESE